MYIVYVLSKSYFFLQIDFMEPRPNHKTLPIWVKRVRLLVYDRNYRVLPNATPTRVLLEYTSPALPVGLTPYFKK